MADAAMRLAGGELAVAISNAAVRILAEYTGRGAERARATVGNDHVFVLLEATLTKAEKRLVDDGKADVVHDLRRTIQSTMRDELVAAVEQLVGREVRAFMSDNHVQPDLAVEIFVLGDALDEDSSPRPGAGL